MEIVKRDLERKQNELKTDELSNLYKFMADYYKHQEIILEESLEEFVNVLKSPFDKVFYVCSHSSQAKKMKNKFIALLDALKTDDNFLVSPFSVAWFENECVWKWKTKDVFVANNGHHDELRKFIYHQIACDNILEQDILDMLPMSLLKVDYMQKVLDMSGYSNLRLHQLADLLNLQDEVIGDGLLVVVESDLKKCIYLSDSFSRCASPKFAIINLGMKPLPLLNSTADDGTEIFLTFDRVLCFFPSSNDGLARNSPEIVRGWTWSASLSHHGNLCEMLNSGLGVLKIGGRLVYAVNSMNPIEGEAVISTVLYQQKGSVKLIDISNELPEIIYEKGLTNWKVMTNQKWYSSASEVPEYLWPQVWTSMFPLPAEITSLQHLDRCIRILPHKQNTSGIFICVLTRMEYLDDAIKREEDETRNKLKEEESLRKKKLEEEAQALMEKRRRKEERRKRKMEIKEDKLKGKRVELSVTKMSNKDESLLNETSLDEPSNKSESVISFIVSKESQEDAEQGKCTESERLIFHSFDMEEKEKLKDFGDQMRPDWELKSGEHVKMNVACEVNEVNNKMIDISHELVHVEHVIDAPISHLDVDSPFFTEIKTFYGLSLDFPQHLLYVKVFENIPFYFYFVSDALQRILRMSLTRHKFVSTGVKVFSYMSQGDLDCRFRITQEGARYILPYMSKQVVHVLKKDIVAILSKPEMELHNLSSSSQNKIAKIDDSHVTVKEALMNFTNQFKKDGA